MADETNIVAAERRRIQVEYQRRETEIPADRYAPWQVAYLLELSSRRRVAASMLHRAGVFPGAGQRCLEVGFGPMGWLGDLITWGVREVNLHGLELDAVRAQRARESLPMADLRTGDATAIPWDSNTFGLVIASTVFSSILDKSVRKMVAAEITRVLAPRGALLWYDFAVDNPGNPNVAGVPKSEVRRLFPTLQGKIKSVTLAPPLARVVTPKSWFLASLLEAIPFLRTHLVGVLIKD